MEKINEKEVEKLNNLLSLIELIESNEQYKLYIATSQGAMLAKLREELVTEAKTLNLKLNTKKE